MKSGPTLAEATLTPRLRKARSRPSVTTVLPLPEEGAAITTALANPVLPHRLAVPIEHAAPIGDPPHHHDSRSRRRVGDEEGIDLAERRLMHRLMGHGGVGDDGQGIACIAAALAQSV